MYHYVLSLGIKHLNYRRDCDSSSFFVLSFTSQISDFLLKSRLFKPTNQQQAISSNTTSTIAPLQSGLPSKKWKLPLPPHSPQRNLSFKFWFAAQGISIDVDHTFSLLYCHCSSSSSSHTAEWLRFSVCQ